MVMKKIFVTVGTTKFPKLIDAVTTEDVLNTIKSLGYNFVQIQTGKEFSKVHIAPDLPLSYKLHCNGENGQIILKFDDLILKYEPYFENFEEEIVNSDLVISHAGAGTCLEVLRKKKTLLVVINEDLMDNHQIELAEELQSRGYLYYSTCDTLSQVLKKDFSKLKDYPQLEKNIFAEYLDKSMGFI
ncbi:unnamed protein product [Psylliodes chrysocephalus]|uniref:UDP-N-acetylglucosamine transferase subunit ALG13 n=1 Tax=Psylliodes chrysocephalus TaxID=3402493 RepID=A0A9P0GAH3_9CUCU|nr:unnamed protein product [Psylliodes chrysocephala]